MHVCPLMKDMYPTPLGALSRLRLIDRESGPNYHHDTKNQGGKIETTTRESVMLPIRVYGRVFILMLCCGILAGCLSPSAVQRVRTHHWPRQLARNALTDDALSEKTAVYLELRGWEGKALREGTDIVLALRQELLKAPARDGLIALAELAYLSGKQADSPAMGAAFLLTATRASYAVLFDPHMGPLLNALDPNVRFAADLYNYALSGLIDVLLDAGDTPRDVSNLAMIEGRLNIERGHGIADHPAFAQTLLAFSHKTEALRRHNRRRGLGVPVVAVRERENIVDAHAQIHPPVRETAIGPATVLLRFEEPWCSKAETIHARAELWNPLSTTHVPLQGQCIPLEADTSLSLAMIYGEHSQYRGILNMPRFLRGDFMVENRGLYLLEPYDPTKIPVLFTHGLMDSALTWVPMLNELLSDPVLSEQYQFWVFFYPTMNPILQSASELRHSLLALHKAKDAQGEAWTTWSWPGTAWGG